MSIGNFEFSKVKLEKQAQGLYLVMKGEIVNNSNKNYHSVVFRAVIFIKAIPVGNITFVINGFNSGQTRVFETQIGELQFEKIHKDITRFELYTENAY